MAGEKLKTFPFVCNVVSRYREQSGFLGLIDRYKLRKLARTPEGRQHIFFEIDQRTRRETEAYLTEAEKSGRLKTDVLVIGGGFSFTTVVANAPENVSIIGVEKGEVRGGRYRAENNPDWQLNSPPKVTPGFPPLLRGKRYKYLNDIYGPVPLQSRDIQSEASLRDNLAPNATEQALPIVLGGAAAPVLVKTEILSVKPNRGWERVRVGRRYTSQARGFLADGTAVTFKIDSDVVVNAGGLGPENIKISGSEAIIKHIRHIDREKIFPRVMSFTELSNNFESLLKKSRISASELARAQYEVRSLLRRRIGITGGDGDTGRLAAEKIVRDVVEILSDTDIRTFFGMTKKEAQRLIAMQGKKVTMGGIISPRNVPKPVVPPINLLHTDYNGAEGYLTKQGQLARYTWLAAFMESGAIACHPDGKVTSARPGVYGMDITTESRVSIFGLSIPKRSTATYGHLVVTNGHDTHAVDSPFSFFGSYKFDVAVRRLGGLRRQVVGQRYAEENIFALGAAASISIPREVGLSAVAERRRRPSMAWAGALTAAATKKLIVPSVTRSKLLRPWRFVGLSRTRTQWLG